MKLTAMAAELDNQLKDPQTFGTLGFEERLALIADAEWTRRQSNKLVRHIKNAHFSLSSVSIEGIVYHKDRKLDKAEILRFERVIELKKTIKSYQKADLLILDEWLIRVLTAQESYDLLEITEARCQKKDLLSFARNMNRMTGM